MTDGTAPDSRPPITAPQNEEERVRAILIRDECLKTTANYANGQAIAVLAIGGITLFYSASVAAPPDLLHRVTTLLGCVVASGGLHLVAHRLLRMLR